MSHLVVDGGPAQREDEVEGHHRQDTKEGGQEDGEPHDRLAQGVPRRSWSSNRTRAAVKILRQSPFSETPLFVHTEQH